MKRKIKFRAWHIEEKLMCKVDTLTDKGAFLVGVKKGEDTHEGKWFIYSPKDGRFCLNNEFELMQFTGLKDKNGKEIYEGDIIENEFGKKIVKWADGGFYCEEEKNIMRIYMWSLTFDKIEIIGNIYENR